MKGLATVFLVSTLVLAAFYLPLCESWTGGDPWKRNLLQAKRALDNMCKVAREHCKREVLNDHMDALPRPRPEQ
ncbi:hypothetical protein OS493_005061 [Desmophyllum pertusum]|uniref:Uncharacterized protein n=1 Tax=Desmophyllum pertusum TaxID=174260 RepID=A0A9X0CT91_9CNID|nr:hypothetical protein OS493_005061 [Desmophyllum pertusum]